MKVTLVSDNTLGVPLAAICQIINSRAVSIRAETSKYQLRIKEDHRSGSDELHALSRNDRLSNQDSYIFYMSAIPFVDNYFYHSIDNRYALSFFGWNHLTDLPLANGILYFICRILLKHELRIGRNHDKSTGCLNDYMWDKSVVDVAMRAAYHCSECRDRIPPESASREDYKDLTALLDLVSSYSRQGRDVLEVPTVDPSPDSLQSQYDVFLCHNSKDKPEVRRLNNLLSSAGIATWFDEVRLEPGAMWQDVLEQEIGSIGACLVIVGSNGEGPWQEMERRAFISEFISRGCRIIPVIIGDAVEVPKLPLFLNQFMWSDLRNDDGRELTRLIGSLRGSERTRTGGDLHRR